MLLDDVSANAYVKCFDECEIRPERLAAVDKDINIIIANRVQYETASKLVNGVPWYIIAVIHGRECSYNFRCHLANGDPLVDKRGVPIPTHHIPRGLRAKTWPEGVVIAFKQVGMFGWSSNHIANLLYMVERYNGFGYRRFNILSPYVWSFTTKYIRGLFVADGRYSSSARDGNAGCAAILKRMIQRGILVRKGNEMVEPVNNASVSVEASAVTASTAAIEVPLSDVATVIDEATHVLLPAKATTLPSPSNGTIIDPSEVIAHDLMVLLGALLSWISVHILVHGGVMGEAVHWLVGAFGLFAGSMQAAIAVYLRQLTVRGTNKNVQAIIGVD